MGITLMLGFVSMFIGVVPLYSAVSTKWILGK